MIIENSKNKVSFGTEDLPTRKRPVLMLGNESSCKVVGYFTNQQARMDFEAAMCRFFEDSIRQVEADDEHK